MIICGIYEKQYTVFYLEIALKDPDDTHIYGFENLSHIPTKKLIEIFGIDLKKDPYLIDGYFLTKTNYKKYKKYIEENMVSLNLNIFEYCLRQYSISNKKHIRKFYKETLME